MTIFRKVVLLIYYGIARHLPSSQGPFGRFFNFIRSILCRALFKSFGKHIRIETKASFWAESCISIGSYSGLGVNCQLQGEVEIGNYVMMGPDVMIWTRNHFINRLDVPMCQQGVGEVKKVIIENDVWIGARVIILPGVKIGTGSVVAAGSVVTKDVPSYVIVAGNPAIIIKKRC